MMVIQILSILQFFTQLANGNHGGNIFKLQNENDENEGAKPQSLKTFHLCSLNKNCTDVVENKTTRELKLITGSEEKEEALKDNNLIWTKMSVTYLLQKKDGGLIQVGARGDQFASVKVDVHHGKYQIKLFYYSGFLICDTSYRTNFGCLVPRRNVNRIEIVVTDNQNKVLLPKGKGYSHDGKRSNSQFAIFHDIIELHPGQQLRFWYKEDLEAVYEYDNSGVAKFYAFAILQH